MSRDPPGDFDYRFEVIPFIALAAAGTACKYGKSGNSDPAGCVRHLANGPETEFGRQPQSDNCANRGE